MIHSIPVKRRPDPGGFHKIRAITITDLMTTYSMVLARFPPVAVKNIPQPQSPIARKINFPAKSLLPAFDLIQSYGIRIGLLLPPLESDLTQVGSSFYTAWIYFK
jgi:hypothetical protein